MNDIFDSNYEIVRIKKAIKTIDEKIDYYSGVYGEFESPEVRVLTESKKSFLELLNECGNDENALREQIPEIAFKFTQLGGFFFDKEDFELAEEYHLEALRLFRMDDDERNRPGMAIAYNNLAFLYEKVDRHEQAIDMYEKSIALWEEFTEQDTEVCLPHYLKTILDCVASLDREDELEKALALCEKAMEYRDEAYADRTGESLYNFAFIAGFAGQKSFLAEKMDSARDYLSKADEAFGFFMDDKLAVDMRASTLEDIGSLYLAEDDISNAYLYFCKAAMLWNFLAEDPECDSPKYKTKLEEIDEALDLCREVMDSEESDD